MRHLWKNTLRVGLTGLALVIVAVTGYQVMEPRSAPETEDNYTRSRANYQIPNVVLQNSEQKPVALQQLLAGDRPVLVQFIFTSCQTVCPLLTATMAQAQKDLRSLRGDTRIVSISIDPEQDTPARMARYATQFEAQGDWTFLTGSRKQVWEVLSAFDAVYSGGNKMNHKPYTFVRLPRENAWLRLVGNLSANQLVREYQSLLTQGFADGA